MCSDAVMLQRGRGVEEEEEAAVVSVESRDHIKVPQRHCLTVRQCLLASDFILLYLFCLRKYSIKNTNRIRNVI